MSKLDDDVISKLPLDDVSRVIVKQSIKNLFLEVINFSDESTGKRQDASLEKLRKEVESL